MSPVEILGMPRLRANRSACVPFPAPGGPSMIRFKAMSRPSVGLQQFCRSACRRDLFRCLSIKLVRAHRQRLVELAAAEHLDLAVNAPHEPMLTQQVRRDDRARLELQSERVEIDHVVLEAE